MDYGYLYEMIDSRKKFATISFLVTFVLVIILVVLLVLYFKSKKNRLSMPMMSKLILSVALAFFVVLFIRDGICASQIAYKSSLDSQELKIQETWGCVTQKYTVSKTGFIVIGGEDYIYSGYRLNQEIHIGEEYDIKYFIHSKLIVDIKEIE